MTRGWRSGSVEYFTNGIAAVASSAVVELLILRLLSAIFVGDILNQTSRLINSTA